MSNFESGPARTHHNDKPLRWEDGAAPVKVSGWLRQCEAVRLVMNERERQDAKWGEQNHDAEMWLVILGEEFGEACQAALADRFGGKNATEKRESQLRKEVVQVAAVALAMLEWMNRSGYGR